MFGTLSSATKAEYHTGNHPDRHLNSLRSRMFAVINTANTMEPRSPMNRCEINHDAAAMLKGKKRNVKDGVTVTVAAGYISGVATALVVCSNKHVYFFFFLILRVLVTLGPIYGQV